MGYNVYFAQGRDDDDGRRWNFHQPPPPPHSPLHLKWHQEKDDGSSQKYFLKNQ